MSKVILIFSGGLDSTVLLYSLLHKGYFVDCVHFQYGSRHNPREFRAINSILSHIGKNVTNTIIHLPFMENFNSSLIQGSNDNIPEGHYQDTSMRSTVVPFRNGILLSIAAGIAESRNIQEIYYGAHTGDHAIYPDCTPDFISKMRSAIECGTYKKVLMKAPFCNMDKSEIVQAGVRYGVPFQFTWTCYKGGEYHCGKCGACQERIEAFHLANYDDPTLYEIDKEIIPFIDETKEGEK